MTREEVKSMYSMADILRRYGLKEPNRAGFISCPFHGNDKHPSMKIYKKDYNCFTCGANGDIFTFVQKMDGLSWKDAFVSLGGTYEKPSFSSNVAVYRAKKAREMELLKEKKEFARRSLNALLITVYRKWMLRSEPMSDCWCECYNNLQYQLYLHEILNDSR